MGTKPEAKAKDNAQVNAANKNLLEIDVVVLIFDFFEQIQNTFLREVRM